jgi:hypothetical protein
VFSWRPSALRTFKPAAIRVGAQRLLRKSVEVTYVVC